MSGGGLRLRVLCVYARMWGSASNCYATTVIMCECVTVTVRVGEGLGGDIYNKCDRTMSTPKTDISRIPNTFDQAIT